MKFFNYWAGSVALTLTGVVLIVTLIPQPTSLLLAPIWGVISGVLYAVVVPRPTED